MTNRSVLYLASLCLSLFLLTACQTETSNTPVDTVEVTSSPQTPSPTPEPTIQPEETVTENTESPSPTPATQLVEISEFDGTKSKKIMIDGKEETAVWIDSGYSDFGFYLPPQMKIVKIYEGNDYKTQDEKGYFNMLEDGGMNVPEEPLWDEQLLIYKEYVGSEDFGNKKIDYFRIEYKDSKAIISLMTLEEEREETQALLLDMMKSIQFIPDEHQLELQE